MTEKKGVARLRQAVENQWAAGEACFSLPIGEAAAICDECEDELSALSWAKGVPVPVDADGNVVPLDTEKMYTDDGEMVRVESICYGAHLWYVRRMYSDKTYWLDSLHLNCPDSWERLEEDVARCDDKLISCAYYNRVLGECDGCPSNGPEYCGSKIMHDILRRAKALAGRGAKEADRG